MTKSNDGCIVIIKADSKTCRNDILISQAVLDKNVRGGTFEKHGSLRHNEFPVYVLTEDLKR